MAVRAYKGVNDMSNVNENNEPAAIIQDTGMGGSVASVEEAANPDVMQGGTEEKVEDARVDAQQSEANAYDAYIDGEEFLDPTSLISPEPAPAETKREEVSQNVMGEINALRQQNQDLIGKFNVLLQQMQHPQYNAPPQNINPQYNAPPQNINPANGTPPNAVQPRPATPTHNNEIAGIKQQMNNFAFDRFYSGAASELQKNGFDLDDGAADILMELCEGRFQQRNPNTGRAYTPRDAAEMLNSYTNRFNTFEHAVKVLKANPKEYQRLVKRIFEDVKSKKHKGTQSHKINDSGGTQGMVPDVKHDIPHDEWKDKLKEKARAMAKKKI